PIIKTFFQCDLNVSLAAKKLYMHRNSLQYRIDKFIEKTGMDIKHFQGAVAVYLAMLIQEYTNH
ncbi:helix-turn-helix domain-containing protein, partial [Parageobacillus thermoglucosidasius]